MPAWSYDVASVSRKWILVGIIRFRTIRTAQNVQHFPYIISSKNADKKYIFIQISKNVV